MSFATLLTTDGGLVYGVPVFLAGALGLALLGGKAVRAGLLRTTGAFLLCAAAVAAAEYLLARGAGAPARYLRWISIFGEGLCVLRLAGIGLFWTLLPALRVRTPRIVEDVVLAGLTLVWTFIWLRENQVDLTGILATSAVVTAVIGFSLQDTLGNILGGMALQLDQSVRVGDWIKVDDVVGRVTEIRWRHTAVETRNWETAVIPNSVLVKNRFLVLGRRQGEPLQWRRWIWFNVGFEHAPSRVMEAVLGALTDAEIPGVAHQPAPNCLLMELGESSARYALRYWLTDLQRDDPTDSDVRLHLCLALRRAGIPFSFPASTVLLSQESPEHDTRHDEQAVRRRLEAIRGVEVFQSLQPEELQDLAARLVPAPFAAGDVMTRQGAEAHWLYVLASGRADVTVEGADGRQSHVAELGAGSFFGEMGLMAGEPRKATVIARTDVDCYRLDKESFQAILHRRPAMAEEISRVLARRRTELEAVLESLDAQARAERLCAANRDILARVRSFFGLGLPAGAGGGAME